MIAFVFKKKGCSSIFSLLSNIFRIIGIFFKKQNLQNKRNFLVHDGPRNFKLRMEKLEKKTETT
jgi:hypothetical protein